MHCKKSSKILEIWFLEFEEHLLKDERPSEYFASLVEQDVFPKTYPFTILKDLAGVLQSRVHHPEGDVWAHTMLVIDNAARVRQRSRNPRAFMWAALLHDVGKVPSTRIKNGRIIAYDHDATGAILARDFLRECEREENYVKNVSALVRWHMQPFFVVRDMPFADIDTMLRQVDLDEVALLSFCDRLGRGDMAEKTVKTEEQNMTRFLEKCKKHIAKTRKQMNKNE